MKTIKHAIMMGAAASMLWGCSVGDSSATFNGPPTTSEPVVEQPPATGNTGGSEVTPQENGPVCEMGRTYKGFGGRVLVAGRVEDPQNVDRYRIKPYSAMAGEYQRVLGAAPNLLSSMGSTFSQPPARWFEEPGASAVTLYSSYRIGFVGCLNMTADPPQYGTAPNETNAAEICRSLATKFWSREPTQSEVDTCVTVATVDTQKETNPRRRWAYTCASLLSSAGFLTY